MENKEIEKLIIGLGSGLLIGGLLGLIFAPYSGKELKMKIADIVDDFTGRVNKFREPEKYSRIKP
jgi:gas vesicle protein